MEGPHLRNNRLSVEFGQDLRAGPVRSNKSPYTRHADALDTGREPLSQDSTDRLQPAAGEGRQEAAVGHEASRLPVLAAGGVPS